VGKYTAHIGQVLQASTIHNYYVSLGAFFIYSTLSLLVVNTRAGTRTK